MTNSERLAELRKKRNGSKNPSISIKKKTYTNSDRLKKLRLERDINLETFEADLNSMGTTLQDILNNWQTEETMNKTRSSVKRMQSRINAYQEYQKMFGGADISELANGYNSALKEWDNISTLYSQYKDADSYAIAKKNTMFDEQFKGLTYDDVQSKLKEYAPDSDEYKYLKDYKNYSDLNDFDKALKNPTTTNAAELIKLKKLRNQYALDNTFDLYKHYMDSKDYEKTSKYKPTKGKDDEWWQDTSDDVYEYINNYDGKTRTKLQSNHDIQQANAPIYTPSKYVDMGLDYLTKDEIGVYNSIYATKGKEEANKFLSDMKVTLNKRATGEITTSVKETVDNSAIASALLSITSVPINIGGAIYGLGETLSGNNNPYSFYHSLSNLSSDIRTEVGNNIAEGTKDWEVFGQNVPSFLYNNSLSIADTTLGTLTAGRLYSVIAGSNAYQQKAKEMVEAGENESIVRSTAFMSGLAETVFEYIGIDNLFKIKNSDSVAKALLKQGKAELFEELGTEGANILSDTILRGSSSEYYQMYEDLKSRGFSTKEITTEIAKKVGNQLFWAGAGGFLSGFVMGGGKSVANKHKMSSIGKTVRSNDRVNDLLDIAQLTPRESEAYNLYTDYALRNNRDNISNTKLGRLYSSIDTDARNTLSSKKSTLEQKRDATETLKKLSVVDEKNTVSKDTINQIDRNIGIREAYKASADELIATGLESGKDTKSYKLATEYKQKLDNGIELTEKEITNLVKANSEAISAEDVATLSEEDAALFKSVYDGKTDKSDFFHSFELVKTLTENNYSADYILEHKGVLSAQQVSEIYKAKVLSSDASLEKAIKALKEKHEGTAFIEGTFDDSVINYDNTNVEGKVNWNSLNSNQKKAIAVLGQVGKRAGMDVKLISDGLERGINGAFEISGNKMLIDIYAGMDKVDGSKLQDTIIPTTSHEMTHWMKSKSPTLYRKYDNYVFGTLTMSGKSESDILSARRKKMEDAHPGEKFTDAEVRDEVIARASEDMFAKSEEIKKFLNTLTDSEKKSFVEKVKEILQNVKEWLNDFLSKQKSTSDEAKIIRQYADRIDGQIDLWDKMLISSISANQALKKEGITGEKLANKTSNNVQEMARGNTNIAFYTETQYNNFGWVRYNDVLSAEEYSTLLSRYADYKHNKDHYPTTRFGEAVIFSFDYPDILMYVKGAIRSPQITKILKIDSSIPDTIQIDIQKEILSNERNNLSLPWENATSIFGEESIDINKKRDFPSFQEYKRRRERELSGEDNSSDRNKQDGKRNVDKSETVGKLKDTEIKRSDRDTLGNTLTEAQQSYFAESKVRDENGNLKVMYHGTPNATFTKFRSGTYFTEHKWYADNYQNQGASSLSYKKTADNPDTYAVYLDIKKPFDTRNKKERDIFYKEYYQQWGTGTDLMESGLPDWLDGQDLQEFLEEKGYDYDGLILDEGATGGYGEEVTSRGLSYVVFNPEQVKSIDNKTPTDNPDYRFSMRENVEETKDLVAVHNLSEEKLLKSLQLGGLPMPSIAIIKAKEGHNTFGNISLVFNKETIDPQFMRANKVYSGDAWTPTYPRIEHKVNDKAQKKIANRINNLVPEEVLRGLGGLHIDSYNLEQDLNRHNGNLVEMFRYNTALKYAFLTENGVQLELPNKFKPLGRYSNRDNDAIIRVAENVSEEKLRGITGGYTKEQIYEVEPEIRKAVNGYLQEKYKKLPEKAKSKIISEDTIPIGQVFDLAIDALNYITDGIEQEVDYYAARDLIEETIDAQKYEAWIKELFANIVEKEGIRNNKDMFTPSGNRRSFEALHYEHNLENVIKAMKEDGTKGIGSFGRGNIFGASTTEYGSIAEIKEDAQNRMKQIPEEKYEEIRKGFSERFFELAYSLPIHKDSFTATDSASTMLVEAVAKFKTKSGMANYLRNESKGWANYSDYVVDDLIQLVSEIRQMPVGYFEAKPQRAVGFDEVATAIIPNSTSTELKTMLSDNGIKFVEYESGNEESRLEALNSLEDVKFSDRDSEGNELSKEQQDFFANSKVRDAEGNLLVCWHGTDADFNTFDYNFISQDNKLGFGFYFMSGKKLQYTYKNPLKTYLNITNPITDTSKKFSKEALSEFCDNLGIKFDYDSADYDLDVYERLSYSYTGKTENFLKAVIDILGVDGIISENRSVAVAFSPEQIKLTTNTNPTPDTDIRYSERNYAPTFYSQMGKVVEGVKQEKLAANSVVNLLRGKGVKAEEIRWSGIVPFLEGKKSVTKQELLDFINGSMLQIGEQMSDAVDIEVISEDGDNYIVRSKETREILDEWEWSDDVEDGLEGWVNQEGEIALTVDEIREKSFKEFSSTRWSDYKLRGGSNYREIVFTMPNSSYSNQMMRTHWGEDAEGVLAHARIQDFDVNGKKMLFIEEIQSDWHNAGHKVGYSKNLSQTESKRIAELDKMQVTLVEQMQEKYQKGDIDGAMELHEQERKLYLERQKIEGNKDGTPDAPFKENYHEFVFKRLLRMAAEQGYDSIGWTPANIQSQRWSDEYAEGYRIEYDQDIPKFLNKYGKKWGAKVGTTTLDSGAEVWSMLITDSMKESVLFEGQVMYSDRDNVSVYDTMGETDRLIKENTQLKEDVERLKERLKLERKITNGNHFNENQLNAVAGHIRSIAKSNYSKPELVNLLKGLYSYIATSKDLNWQDMFAQAYDIASMVLNEAKPVTETNEYYKWILNDIRGAKISVNEQQIQNARYKLGNKWRNAFFNKVKIADNAISLDRQWQEWSNTYPDLFDAEISDADQLVELYDIYDSVKESSEVIIEYDTEEQTRWLAREIYNQYWNVSPIRTTAEKYDKQIKLLNYKHREAMNQLRDNYEDRLKSQHKADRQKAIKLAKEIRERKDKEIAEVKKHSKERIDAYKDNAARKTKIQSITTKALTLNEWLLKNSKEKHIHESLKGPVANLLQAIDFSSKQLLGIRGGKYNGMPTRKDISLQKSLSQVKDMMLEASVGKEELIDLYGHDLDDDIKLLVESVDNIMRTVGDNEFILNKMTLNDLNTLDNMLKTIKQAVTKMNQFHSVHHAQGIASLGQEEIRYAEKLGNEKIYVEGSLKSGTKKMLKWTNSVPYYAFKRFGEAGKKIFEAFQDGWDKMSFNVKEVIDFTKKTYKTKEVREWEKEIKSFNVLVPATNSEKADPNYKPKTQKIQMTTAQVMYLYLLNKRASAKAHLLGGGIVVSNIETEKSELISQPEGVLLEQSEIDKIIQSLNKRQIEVADALSKFMNTVCSDWGNEVSMARFGYKAFGEPDYVPMQVDKDEISTADPAEKNNSLFKLLNMPFTKGLTEGANNRLVISSIFDVFAQHTSDMAKYNALALPVLDAFKWYNYKEIEYVGEEAKVRNTVKKSIGKAFGKDGQNYITTLLEDINGQNSLSRDKMSVRFFKNSKLASVGMNLRVILLQPTSYFRASANIDNEYLIKALAHKPKIAHAEKYCGMALWKSLGYYDTNIQRGVAEQIKHAETGYDKLIEWSMKGAGEADRLTLGYLWNAAELEIRKTRKDLKVGSEEFFLEVGKRLRDIIYSTQVVDSTLTRSEFMRSPDGRDKILSMFASEPTLAYNILQDVYIQTSLDARELGDKKAAFKKNGKKIARAITAYTVTNAVAALVESGFDAWRDDDDEEFDIVEFMKLYLANFAADMSIVGKIPYLKDGLSILQGYSPSRSDVQWMQSAYYTLLGISKHLRGEGNPVTTTKNGIKTFSYVSGLPFYNAYRDLMATLDKLDILSTEELEEMFKDLFGIE